MTCLRAAAPDVHCLLSNVFNTSTGNEAAFIHLKLNDQATNTPNYADMATLVKQRWKPLVISEIPLPSLWMDPLPCDRGQLSETPYANANMSVIITTAAAASILIFSFDERAQLHDFKALSYRDSLGRPPRREEKAGPAEACGDPRD
jgi:hypothetical protein